MSDTPFDDLLDASGQNCPMPVVNARKAIGALAPGQVLKVVSTDRGSVKDFQGWAKVDRRIALVGQETEGDGDGARYIHFLERSA